MVQAVRSTDYKVESLSPALSQFATERPGVRSNYSIIGLTVGRDAPAAIGPGGRRQPAEPGKRDRA
jgi:hypothetical protein